MGNTEPETNPQGLSQDEMKELVGGVFDEKTKGFNERFASKEDVAALRTGIVEDVMQKIGALPTPTATASIDEDGLMKKIGSVLDAKLAGIGVNVGRAPGPLGRWLGF